MVGIHGFEGPSKLSESVTLPCPSLGSGCGLCSLLPPPCPVPTSMRRMSMDSTVVKKNICRKKSDTSPTTAKRQNSCGWDTGISSHCTSEPGTPSSALLANPPVHLLCWLRVQGWRSENPRIFTLIHILCSIWPQFTKALGLCSQRTRDRMRAKGLRSWQGRFRLEMMEDFFPRRGC